MAMTTVAMAGASGKLGRLAMAELLAKMPAGELVAIVRDPAKVADFAEAGVRIRQADYTEPELLGRALAGVDTLAFVSSSAKTGRADQHLNVIAAAKEAGVRRIIYTSLLDAPHSTHVLAADHRTSEDAIAESGIPHTFLRNGWYTENFAREVHDAVTTGVIPAATKDGRIASASRKDYAAALAAAVLLGEDADAAYELSGDVAWTHEEMAATLSEILAKPVRFEPMDGPALLADQLAKGISQARAEFVVRMDSDVADGTLALVTGDLARLIGRPPTPYAETLAQLVRDGATPPA